MDNGIVVGMYAVHTDSEEEQANGYFTEAAGRLLIAALPH